MVAYNAADDGPWQQAEYPDCDCSSHCDLSEAQRFDLRFPFRAAFSIKKSSSFFPLFIAATSHLGFAPRPAQVSPEGLRYFGGTFVPFNALAPVFRRPTTPIALFSLSNCRSTSARCLQSVSSIWSCRSRSAPTSISDRFIFSISGLLCEASSDPTHNHNYEPYGQPSKSDYC